MNGVKIKDDDIKDVREEYRYSSDDSFKLKSDYEYKSNSYFEKSKDIIISHILKKIKSH